MAPVAYTRSLKYPPPPTPPPPSPTVDVVGVACYDRGIYLTDAYYDKGITFRMKFFLNPKSSEVGHFVFFCMVLVCARKVMEFFIRCVAVFFSALRISFRAVFKLPC